MRIKNYAIHILIDKKTESFESDGEHGIYQDCKVDHHVPFFPHPLNPELEEENKGEFSLREEDLYDK
jgi:hypothetical protein